ncbi:MAG: hypothetical protein R3D29_05620 [Nitratireductor sp.]
MIHLIWRTERLGDVIAGCRGRFGGLTILPLHSRSGDTASRVTWPGTCGLKAPWQLPAELSCTMTTTRQRHLPMQR